MSGAKLIVQTTVTLLPGNVAQAFCDMDDDEQAQVFVEVAKIMGTWEPHRRLMQLHAIGRHLRDCDCSTEAARDVVQEIVAALEPNT